MLVDVVVGNINIATDPPIRTNPHIYTCIFICLGLCALANFKNTLTFGPGTDVRGT